MAIKMVWLTPDRFDIKPDKSTWVEMARAFSDMGYSVTILTSRSKDGLKADNGYEHLIHYVNANDLPFIFRVSVLFRMYKWLKNNISTEDIIVMNQDSLLLVPFLRRLGVKYIHLDIRTLPVEMHSLKDRLDRLLFWSLPLKEFGNKAFSYSFITTRLMREIENEFGYHYNDYVIWQSGVSTEIFYPQGKDVSRQYKFRLFYHGTVSLNRGIDLVIKSISLLNKDIDLEFVIVGDGSGLQKLKELAADLSIEDKIIFRGFVPYENIINEISLADICICPLPNRLEWEVSSPIKVFEYMACAKPMILTPISAHKDVVGNEKFVVWTPGFAPEDFANAIEVALDLHGALIEEAKIGPEIISKNYEWRCQADKLEKHIKNRINSI